VDCAEKAAPYVHAKLEHSVFTDKKRRSPAQFSDDELLLLAAVEVPEKS
jgi:hypothetical protein